MAEFESNLIGVSDGAVTPFKQVLVGDHFTEAQLEAWIVERPALAGEELLMLGAQLAPFSEDRDRLDVLALDRAGEIVLLELKVSEEFRVTELQALAYAGAYAAVTTEQLADTLRKTLSTTNPSVTQEQAREEIESFLESGFDDWQPSKRIRIKLIAPSFPKRVLRTVKWLGDVYDMPIEAIQVRLFLGPADQQQLTFERVLPLPGEEDFDMTVREEQAKQQTANRSKRPAVLPTLIESGVLKDGDTIYFARDGLPPDSKDVYDPERICFQMRVDASGGTPKFRWKPTPDSPEEVLIPSRAWYRVYRTVLPDRNDSDTGAPVHSYYTLSKEGPTLGEVAIERGLWT